MLEDCVHNVIVVAVDLATRAWGRLLMFDRLLMLAFSSNYKLALTSIFRMSKSWGMHASHRIPAIVGGSAVV